MAPLAHIQFWTAGKGVNCGVHNHAKDIFCEKHMCLSPGTGNGGMAGPKPEYAKKDLSDDERNKLGPEAFDFLALKELEEHGGMWERDSDGRSRRTNRKVDTMSYPWHKWQGGDKKNVGVWMAVEFDPRVVDQAVENGQKT
ncbi:hypothetical protein PG995_012915 [Apiospora arundinis]